MGVVFVVIAPIAIGALLIAVFAISVERRNEWRMRERRIQARRARASARSGPLEADGRATDESEPPAPSATGASPNSSGWWRRQGAHRRKVFRPAPSRSTGS